MGSNARAREVPFRHYLAIFSAVVVGAVLFHTMAQQSGGFSISAMSGAGSESDTGSASGTSTPAEACTGTPFVMDTDEDFPLPSDARLHPNAQARIDDAQKTIAALKHSFQYMTKCGDQELIRQHINMHRDEVRMLRQGTIVPIRGREF